METIQVRIKLCLERRQVLSVDAPGPTVPLHLFPSHLQVLPLVDFVHQ
jgi:hypothetical protein